MTWDELNRHLDLMRDLQRAQETLQRLYAKASPGAQKIDGMPHAPGVNDKVGALAVEIAEYSQSVDELRRQVRESSKRVEAFLQSVDDRDVRLLLRLRFQRALSWKEIADHCGEYTSEASVKTAVYGWFRDRAAQK